MARVVPFTRNDMQNAGYTFQRATTCRACGQQVEAWLTPKKKHVLYDVVDSEWKEPPCHFQTCPKRGARSTERGPVDLHTEARRIAERLGLRLVILQGEGEADPAYCYKLGQNPDDLRSDCISVGNRIRNEVEHPEDSNGRGN